MKNTFLQIHTLHSYPSALLNRDEDGLAKRLPFGGSIRTRISSQCLKKHWKDAKGPWSLNNLNIPLGTRSRYIFEEMFENLKKTMEEKIAETIVGTYRSKLLPTKEVEEVEEKKEKKGEKGKEKKFPHQTILLGKNELDFLEKSAMEIAVKTSDLEDLKKEAANICKNLKSMIEKVPLDKGLTAALFGRMITSDLLANSDAAIHVAHAFTVHAQESESDYFTVFDDLIKQRKETGAAHLDDMELTSGLYYGYVVIDLETLWKNLGKDPELTGRVVEHLLHLIAKQSPGAKLGSTAPYSWADFCLVELGNRQPRTLANAFRNPVPLKKDGQTLELSLNRIAGHLKALDDCYGMEEKRSFSSPHSFLEDSQLKQLFNELAKEQPFNELAKCIGNEVIQNQW